MKPFLPIAFLLLASVGLSGARAQETDSTQASQDAVAQRLAKLERSIETLEAENAETKRKLDLTLRYLDKQARGSKGLIAQLEESERLGFTAGMNPRSREVLRGALRSFWTTQQEGVPRATPAPSDASARR